MEIFMGKIIIVVMIFNLTSKLFAFFRELSLAYFFGASALTDAYIVAFSIPTIIFGIVGSGILNGYIPIYNQIKENSNDLMAKKFTNNFSNIMLVTCFLVFITGFFFSSSLVKIFSYGFDQKTLGLASFFTKISLLTIFPLMLVSIFSGYLQLNNKFFAVAFIGVPTNLLYIIGTYIAYKNTNFNFLIFFSCFALIFQFIFLCPFIFKTGYRHNLKINIHDKNLQQLLTLSIPIILGTSLMFGIITLNKEVSIFIFGRGNLDKESVLATAKCLSFYSLCFVALCLRDLSTKIFYSFKNSKTPVINSSIGIILNIILNITLSKYLGVSGIALATSISTIFISILLFYNLKRYDIYLDKGNFITLFKVLLASAFMIFIIYISKSYLSSLGNLSILIYMVNAGVSYILSVLLLGISEIKDLFRLFLKVFKLKR